MKLEPCNDHALVRHVPDSDTTKGGILLPERVNEGKTVKTVEVLAVGPGLPTMDGTIISPGFTVGDRLLVKLATGYPVDIDGENLFIIRSGEVLGVIR